MHEKGNHQGGVGSDEALPLLLFEKAVYVNRLGEGCSNKGVGLSIQSPVKQMEKKGQERGVGSKEIISLPSPENAASINGMREGCMSNGVGLPAHSPLRHLDHVPHNPKHISDSNSRWKVYSRNWRCKKKLQIAFAQPDATNNPQIQYSRDMEQAGNGPNDNTGSATEPTIQNEGDNVNQQIQEAAEIWSMAKQLGVTGGPD